MKKCAVLMILLLLTGNAFAAVSLQWSKDINSLVNLSGYTTSVYGNSIESFADDSVCIIFDSENSSSPSLLVLLDKDGDLIFNTTNAVRGSSFPSFSNTSNRFAIVLGYSQAYRFFERNDDASYSYFDIDAINLRWSGDGVNPPRSLYTMSGAVLSKYTFDSVRPILAPSTSGVQGPNFKISWESESGIQYLIQKSEDISIWSDVGTQITGTGGTLNWSTSINSTSEFYRVTLNN